MELEINTRMKDNLALREYLLIPDEATLEVSADLDRPGHATIDINGLPPNIDKSFIVKTLNKIKPLHIILTIRFDGYDSDMGNDRDNTSRFRSMDGEKLGD